MSDILLFAQVVWEKRREYWPHIAFVVAFMLMCVGYVWVIYQTLLWAWPV